VEGVEHDFLRVRKSTRFNLQCKLLVAVFAERFKFRSPVRHRVIAKATAGQISSPA
jgi:hypothetical protein